MAIRGELFSSQFMTDKRTYFFNVKENRTGSHFLNIVESKKMPNGEFERHSVMVYEEDMENFMKELMKAARFVNQKPDFRSEHRSDSRSDSRSEYRTERKPEYRSERRFDSRSERRSEHRFVRRTDRDRDRDRDREKKF